MRIIDKNTDFYDFWQGVYPDRTVTFDRTDSFLLTKEIFCEHLAAATAHRFRREKAQAFCLLQVCNTFWLFLAEVTEETEYWFPKDYAVERLASWKNYSVPRRLIRLDLIDFDWQVSSGTYSISSGISSGIRYDKVKLRNRIKAFTQAVDTGNFRVLRSINSHTIYKDGVEKETRHIPLLKACGIGNLVESLDIFLAFEEYFSLEKSASERTESVGLTDKEKVGNHGFDVKTSFRGK